MAHKNTYGIIAAILGVFLFSTKAVFVKLLYAQGVSTLESIAFRLLYSLPIYFIILVYSSRPKNISVKDVVILGLLGCFGYYLSIYFDFLGLNYIPASLERLILFIYPTLVLLYNWVFFQENLENKQIFGIGLTYTGILFLFVPEILWKGWGSLVGGLWVILSAALYAGYLSGTGRIIKRYSVVFYTSAIMIIASITGILHFLVSSSKSLLSIFAYEPSVQGYAILLALIATILPTFLISWSIRLIGSGRFSIFASLGPISTVLLAYFILNERMLPIQFLGAAILFSGVLIAEWKAWPLWFFRRKEGIDKR